MILLCIAEVGSSSTDLLASYWRTDNHIKSLKLIKQATRYPLPPEYLFVNISDYNSINKCILIQFHINHIRSQLLIQQLTMILLSKMKRVHL